MLKLALLDDYQGVALSSADWDSLAARCSVTAFRDHLTDEAEHRGKADGIRCGDGAA